MSSPRQYPIRKALTDPILVLGCERHLIWPLWIVVIGGAAACLFKAPQLAAIAVIVGGLGQMGLRQLAKKDPLWSKVFWRARGQQRHYHPHSRVGA